jgi:hypothetical protein
MDIAENSLFLSMASILWAFNVSKAVGLDGVEIVPDPEDIMGGLAAMPAAFPARILPRSNQRAGAVRAAWRAAQENLSKEDGQWKHVPSALPLDR